MSIMEKRLKRLEGPQAVNGETPVWCMDRARVEADLGFIAHAELEARAGAIAGQYRSAGDYSQHQQQKHHNFVTQEG